MEILVSIQEFVGYDTRMVILVCSHYENDGGHGISCEFCCFLSEGAKVQGVNAFSRCVEQGVSS